MNDSLRNSNPVEILKTFSKDEVKEFDKFVHSPFFNCRNDVTRLFRELKRFYPTFDGKNFREVKKMVLVK